MSSIPQIQDLASLVEPHLNGGKLLSYEAKYLIGPMENYGSCLLALTLSVQTKKGEKQNLDLVAKIPSVSTDMDMIFQPDITFLKENRIYTDMAPVMAEFQRDRGVPEDQIIDVFAKSYGARINFDGSEKFDKDAAALIMENLTLEGYRVAKRLEGFTHEETLFLLDNLAKYHAIPIAMRKLQPDTYKKIMSIFQREMKPNPPPDETSIAMMQKLFEGIAKIVPTVDLNKLKGTFPRYFQTMTMSENDGLFCTIAHNDFWVNNIMLKYDASGKPQSVKFIDFQITKSNSLINDLLFFIFSSVNPHIIRDHLDEYFQYYFEKLVFYLEQMGFDASEYTVEKFRAAVGEIGPIQMAHCLFMYQAIHSVNESIKEHADFNLDTFGKGRTFGPNFPLAVKTLIEVFTENEWF